MLGRGGTIGILGGGQLGRMMAMSAAQLGYRCIAYAPEGDNVVSQVCDDVFHNKWDDNAALAAFAAQCAAGGGPSPASAMGRYTEITPL